MLTPPDASPRTTHTPKHKTTKSTESGHSPRRSRDSLPHWSRRKIRYRFRDGSIQELAERTVAIIYASHIGGCTKTEMCEHFQCTPDVISRAIHSANGVLVMKDMLARLKEGGELRAYATLMRNMHCGDPKTEVVAADRTLDRLEGKATQRVTVISEHTETVRFVVNAPAPAQLAAPSLAMVKDPATGRWVQAEQVENTRPAPPQKSRSDEPKAP